MTNTPDMVRGVLGVAHRVAVPDPPRRPAQDATLAQWFLHLPQAHPVWSRYVLSVVHLRDLPGVPPATKRSPDMAYELMLLALNPERQPRPDDRATWQHLTPPNIVEQFGGVTDEQAVYICGLVARALVDGVLPAEPQGILGAYDYWKRTLANTIEHVRIGAHGVPTKTA